MSKQKKYPPIMPCCQRKMNYPSDQYLFEMLGADIASGDLQNGKFAQLMASQQESHPDIKEESAS